MSLAALFLMMIVLWLFGALLRIRDCNRCGGQGCPLCQK